MQASPRTSPLTNNALLVARCDFPRRHAELNHAPRNPHIAVAAGSAEGLADNCVGYHIFTAGTVISHSSDRGSKVCVLSI